MEREKWMTLLAVLGVTALVVVLVSPWSPIPGARVPGGKVGDIIWRQGYPVGHQGHVADPGDMGSTLPCHPLYRRPLRPGHNRQCLIDLGWDWIANPPSEQGL